MSISNPGTRSLETHSAIFLSRLDKNELRGIKVAITRRNVSEPNSSTTLLRSLDDPSQLVVHFRPGKSPIFERDDIVVNQEKQEERTILSSLVSAHNEQKAPSSQAATSRSSSRSSRSSPSPTKFLEKKRVSPQPHTSRDLPRDKDRHSSRYRRSASQSRKAVYKTQRTSPPRSRYSRSSPGYSRKRSLSPHNQARARREQSSGGADKRYRVKPRSRSPNGYRGPPDRRRSSRSPLPSHKTSTERGRYGSRSPYKYRPPDRKRSKSPPPSRGRSRSRSPYHSRSRYSRSPHRHDDYRRYERSKRSRSPRHRYTPERHSRRSPRDERSYQGPRIPSHHYFEGAEFWIPDPSMQPRFMPRQMIPPGAFPFGPPFRPAMPIIMPPRMPFRPRIVYNSNKAPRPKITPALENQSSTANTATEPAATVSNITQEENVKDSEPTKSTEHSSPKNDNQEN